MEKPKYSLHLFAGGGGGLLADALHGVQPVCAVEIEDFQRKVLQARYPNLPLWDDVCTFRSDNAECAEAFAELSAHRDELVIAGGFPHQAHCDAGQRPSADVCGGCIHLGAGGIGGTGMMQQGTFEDTNAEYAEFCKKFAPKKTTDDCYTPPNVYNAVFDWVARRYGLTTDTPVVRPFVPGGDFERFDYPKDALVLDNPPFSILSKIVKFYNANGVRFFLFAPALTLFSGSADTQTNYVIAGASITYENGAVVNTSFVTNMGEYLIETAPDLRAAVKAANEANRASTTKELPTYRYPDCVAHAAGLNYLAVHGQAFKVRRRDALFVRSLDAMRDAGKAIFGGGYLLTEAVAAERAEAEAAAAEQAAAERAEADRIALARAKETQWQLSDREREMQKLLARPART